MEQTTGNVGVINLNDNSFAKPSWIQQGYPLTPHRKGQLMAILGSKVENIVNANSEKYVAFLAIRWGFAKIDDSGKLQPTTKWSNRQNYDGYGQ